MSGKHLKRKAPAVESSVVLDTSECDRIQPNRVFKIQPHCMFAWLRADSLRMERVSANLGELISEPASELLGRGLDELLTPAALKRVHEIATRLPEPGTRRMVPLEFINGEFSDGILYASNGGLCVEFERPQKAQPAQVAFELEHAMEQLLDCYDGDSAGLATVVCRILREISGYGRAYYCQFEEDGHGYVPGEDITEGWSSLLDHHFPASDVPDGARAVYLQNPFRQVADAQATDVPLLSAQDIASETPDLTLSNCRAIAPTHLLYLNNMGVRASASFSVIRNNQLLGLFGLHDRLPGQLSFRQLNTCYRFVRMYASRYAAIRAQENHGALVTRTRALHDAFHLKAANDENAQILPSVVAERLLDLFEADAIICRIHGEIQVHGLQNRQVAHDLMHMLEPHVVDDQIVLTNGAVSRFPELRPVQHEIGGLCALGLDRGAGNLIIWVRHERLHEYKWSGDPEKPVQVGPGERLTPRQSFDTFLRRVSGTCEPWDDWHRDFADMVRQVVNQYLLTVQSELMRREAERSNLLKSEFVANVSHELRSPLHSIIGLSDSLKKRNETLHPDQRLRYAETINRSSERLLALINDLLDLAKLEAGRMVFNFSEADLAGVLSEVIEEAQPVADRRQVRLVVHDARQARLSYFDRSAMHRLFTNLVSNAIKFTDVNTNVDIELTDNENEEIQIVVRDHGVGIDAGELELVFDKFVQSSRTKTGAGGTGLGLPICREIVSAHRGYIHADNNENGGATFRVRLPVKPLSSTIS